MFSFHLFLYMFKYSIDMTQFSSCKQGSRLSKCNLVGIVKIPVALVLRTIHKREMKNSQGSSKARLRGQPWNPWVIT